ncbi:MAG TPA: histidine kinase dimerization/phosphoacceptor domain -containing protein [Micropepsaceae bacterium]|nr:histidine kinase dimerization/phosphoacceptor domain -containing protein [Micropepsaceae bacterium]
MSERRTIEKLLRQQAALANFGSFAFRERDLKNVLTEAARVCAESLGVPFAKICRHRKAENDLIVDAGHGWHSGVVGSVVSAADEKSTQGRAFVTGEPVILEDLTFNNSYALPAFYAEHRIVATADVLIKGTGEPWGVLEVDSAIARKFDQHDIMFLTGFANVIAEAVATAERIAVLHTTIEQMESLIAEKEVLAGELQHRVRNNLQLISGMLSRQIDVSDSGGKEGIRAIARRVMSLAAIYDHLLGNGLSHSIEFGRYLRSLCDSLRDFQEAREFAVTLICDGKLEPLPLDLDTVTSLGIVVGEIISNAYLHAFPGRTGTIHVILTASATGATLTIRDDGVGFVEPPFSKRHGLGLVRRLIEQIGGTVRVVSDHGTEWTIAVPNGVSGLKAA